MLTKLLNFPSTSFTIFFRTASNLRSDFELGKQMKLYNDNKQFKKVLDLFDHYNENNNAKTCYSLVITQVLKACAHLGDIKRGKVVHEMVSSRAGKDLYILVSLIHMYSKFKNQLVFLRFHC